MIKDQKEFVDRMKIEMHYINELNAQLEETKLDIKIQRNQNKEVLRSNIDQLFDEHRFYLEKVDSYYRKLVQLMQTYSALNICVKSKIK